MKKKIAIKALNRLLNEGSGISTMGIPRDIEEMITDWMNRDYDGFYVELAAFINENYRGSCLDFLEHWYDKSLIEQNWPDTEYPWYSHEKFDLWGDGVELGGELEDSDPYSDEMTNPDPAVIGPLIEKYVDHADTDFWKFLYANFGDKLANWLEEVNGSAFVKENRMKKGKITLKQLKKLIKESNEGGFDEVALEEFTTKLGEEICLAVQGICEGQYPEFVAPDVNDFLYKLISTVKRFSPDSDSDALMSLANKVVYGE